MADKVDINVVDDQLDYEESLVNVTDENEAAAEVLVMQERIREIEQETEKLNQLQGEVNRMLNMDNSLESHLNMSLEEKIEVDSRSIFIGNVDYDASAEELEQHFYGCGSINRVNIGCDKFNGHPKGYAYIEFQDVDSVQTAMTMDESLFKGRHLKVMQKRTNRPGISTTNRRPRGRGFFRGSRRMGRGFHYHGEPIQRRSRGYSYRFYPPY